MKLNNDTLIFKGSTPWNGKIFRGTTLIWPTVPPRDYSTEYFTLEVIDTGNTGEFNFSSRGAILDSAEFSVNEGAWKYFVSASTVEKTVSLGDTVRVRCVADSLTYSNILIYSARVGITGAKYKVYGNIMSLLYGSDFSGKTSFQAGSKYHLARIFNEDTYIVDAKNLILPATTLADNCYRQMFQGATSLVNGPEILPATTLAKECYSNMFGGCASLVKAPILPAATLVDSCYAEMFYNCPNLNYVKCLATDISANSCTSLWLARFIGSVLGTFVKHLSMNSWTISDSGIPSGWTVQDAVL